MIRFYDDLLKSCKKVWQEVYDTFMEFMLKMDKEAIMWLRGERRMIYNKSISALTEEIPIAKEYLASLLRTLEETRKWKVTIEEERSLKITFKGLPIDAKKKVTYPVEISEFMRKIIVETLPAERILVKKREAISSAVEEKYGKSEQRA